MNAVRAVVPGRSTQGGFHDPRWRSGDRPPDRSSPPPNIADDCRCALRGARSALRGLHLSVDWSCPPMSRHTSADSAPSERSEPRRRAHAITPGPAHLMTPRCMPRDGRRTSLDRTGTAVTAAAATRPPASGGPGAAECTARLGRPRCAPRIAADRHTAYTRVRRSRSCAINCAQRRTRRCACQAPGRKGSVSV